MKKTVRIVAASAAVAAGMGLAGLAVATEARAQPGPLPTWCPGEFWDPGWGNNWEWGGCHDNFRGLELKTFFFFFFPGWAWRARASTHNFDRHEDFGRR